MTGDGGWIGLNDKSKESKFLWNYNKFDQPTFFAWDKGDTENPEPNNFNGQCNVENCVEMNAQNQKWNDVVCKAHRSYLCERKSNTGKSCVYLKGGGGGGHGPAGSGALRNFFTGGAPLRGPTFYPFIYHFDRKATPFIYL